MTLYCVDVDGTLTKGEKKHWEEEPDPDEEMVNIVNQLYKDRHHIIIWTARRWKDAEKTARWLQKHNVLYHGLRMDKGSGEKYIDDRTINAEDFKDEFGD